MPPTRRTLIENSISDLVTYLLWEDRKEDEDLPRGAIEAAISADEITVDEISALFAKELRAGVGK